MSAPNNRPDYAPERRPGDALETDLERTALELIAVHLDRRDGRAIAALLEAGAAALKYAPGHATDAVAFGRRRVWVRLGTATARAIRTELDRLDERDHRRNVDLERARRRAEKAGA